VELQRSTILDRGEWNRALGDLPGAHVLQTWEWGEFKAGYGWTAERLLWRTVKGRPVAAAQVLERRVRVPVLGLSSSVLYAPRGPVLDWRAPDVADHVLRDLGSMAARPGVLQLKIDPDLPVGYGLPGSAESGEDPTGTALGARLLSLGYRPSPEQIQFRNTFVLDLRPGDACSAT
jgi:lipid II:glycine glycyltransferase (peptidoglycan interpeptide bridge formation enzyme)